MPFRALDSIAVGGEALWLLIGRVLMGVLFLPSGWGKLMDPSRMTGMLTGKGAPAPLALAILAAVVEFFGALAVVVGFKTRCAALAMAVFTVIAAFLGHPYWTLEGAARQPQYIQFYKDLAIVAGFLFLFVRGAGPWSIDRR